MPSHRSLLFLAAAAALGLGVWGLISARPRAAPDTAERRAGPRPTRPAPAAKADVIELAPATPKKPKVPLGPLSVAPAAETVEEGANLDLTLALCNQVPDATPHLITPDGRFASLGYRVERVAPEPGKPFDTLPPTAEVLARHGPQSGPRFELKLGEVRTFHGLLLDAGDRRGLTWLPPGTYQIQALYLSLPEGTREVSVGDERIEFHKPLVSPPFRLTVTEPPPERRRAVALAKAFLAAELDDPKDLLTEYHEVLAARPAPSLEKRVRYHAALRLWARSFKPGVKDLAVAELEALARMPLTPGEAEQVHDRLAEHYLQAGDGRRALRWSRGHTTPWAELVRESVP
jgi:hypothetical protein